MKKIRILFLMVSAILALSLVGCSPKIENESSKTENLQSENESDVESTQDEKESETDQAVEATTDSTEDSVTYPLVIKHAFGETVLETKPERVATIAWANHDTPLALGLVPVGISKANYGVTDDSGLLPWTKDAYTGLGVNQPYLFDDLAGLDFEAISDAKPDVILAAYSGITQEEYDLLSEIAPVVAYPKAAWQTYWRDQILMNAQGLGMETQGQALVEELEALIKEKSQAYANIAGKSAAFFWFNPTDLGKFYVYLPADPRAAYLTDLGMTFPQSVLDLAGTSDSFALELSAENVDVLNDVDIIITYGAEGLVEILQADALVGTIPAVKNGAIAIIPDGTPLAASGTPSPLSIPYTIDEYLSLIGQAADQVQ